MKKIFIKIRSTIKFLILIIILMALIVGIFAFVYKPIYKVTLGDEVVGYCAQKSKLQAEIAEFVEKGNEDNKNLAFVEVDNMPTYSLCLLKRGITTNDDEIFEKVKQTGTAYYRYYTILEDNEEKYYVPNFEMAESVVNKLKEKDSNNIDNIQILEKYETNLQNFATEEEAVAGLYKKKEKVVEKPVVVAKKVSSGSTKSFSTKTDISKSSVSLGVSLIKPVTGSISSRFGSVSRVRSSAHTGLDIAAPYGTSVKAAASGTVTWAGYKGSYGNLLVITHSNGVQTYYGHCSSLHASAGQTVSQGQSIASVGSTGNSTGNHLHFEIRVNGVAYNPQNYVY